MSESTNSPDGEKIHDLDRAESWEAPKRKILILDDDFTFADLTRLHLERIGYEVELAADGVQGITKIMADDYSAILCDMVMPNLAGDMFYTAVERVKPHLCSRIIFVTGQRGDRKVEEFIRKVHAPVLWKPFQMRELFETIRSVEKKPGGNS
jgi:CheY-like chemotaxis protein